MENKDTKTQKASGKIIAVFAVVIVLAALVCSVIFPKVIVPAIRYSQAEKLADEGNYAAAALAYGKLSDYKDANSRSLALWDQVAHRETIASAGSDLIAIKEDGTVAAIGYSNAALGTWTDIVAVSISNSHVVGLKADGTVAAEGFNRTSSGDHHGRCDVEKWENIVSIVTSGENTFGLRKDGTVVAAGPNQYGQRNVSQWTDIVAIYPGGFYFTVGLKADGTVVSTEFIPANDQYKMGSNDLGQNRVAHWTDIQSINALPFSTLGLHKDGTVVAAGSNTYGKNDVNGWRNIVALANSNDFSLGLHADGTAVATGDIADVQDWTDIIEISAGTHHAVGLKEDGTVVAVGNNDFGQCDVQKWTGIVKILAGNEVTFGLKADGTLVFTGKTDSLSAAADWNDLKAK